jgi:hypothetical protein
MGNLLTAVIAAFGLAAVVGLTINMPVKVKSTYGDKAE